jgi:hypothetical protein
MEGLHKGPRIEVLPEPSTSQKPGEFISFNQLLFTRSCFQSKFLNVIVSCEFFLEITVAFPYTNQRHYQKDHV